MRRSAGAAGLFTSAALALLAAGAVFPGPAAADTGGPAGWVPRGRPLAGAATTADAPAMRPGTVYRDTIRPGESRFYGLALDASASAAVSAFVLPPAGARVAYNDGVELTLRSADGSRCDSAGARFQDEGDPRPLGTAVSRLIGVGSACQSANQYTLEVHRTSDPTSHPGVWPLELDYAAEPPLRPGSPVASVPPGSTATGTPSPTPLTSGSTRPARGGTDFADAAPLRTGIWRDSVLPGETRFYRVPVDWGQRATVFADFAGAPAPDAAVYIGGGVRLAAYSPVREFLGGDSRSYQGAPASLSTSLGPVAYGNRASGDPRVAGVRYAGSYYLAVTVHPRVAAVLPGAVPVTLRVEVSGDASAAPPYAGEPAGLGASRSLGAAGSSGSSGVSGTAAVSGGTSGLRFLAFAALGAGTVLLLTLAWWYAGGWRRGRVGDAVPPRDRVLPGPDSRGSPGPG